MANLETRPIFHWRVHPWIAKEISQIFFGVSVPTIFESDIQPWQLIANLCKIMGVGHVALWLTLFVDSSSSHIKKISFSLENKKKFAHGTTPKRNRRFSLLLFFALFPGGKKRMVFAAHHVAHAPLLQRKEWVAPGHAMSICMRSGPNPKRNCNVGPTWWSWWGEAQINDRWFGLYRKAREIDTDRDLEKVKWIWCSLRYQDHHRNTVYSSIQGKENALLYRNIYNIYPLVQFNPSHCKWVVVVVVAIEQSPLLKDASYP